MTVRSLATTAVLLLGSLGAACGGDGADPDAALPSDAGAGDGAVASDAAPQRDAEPSGDAAASSDGGATCPEGFRAAGDACVDIDECAEGADACGERECRNADGSYTCACGAGEAWTGSACAPIGPQRIDLSSGHGCHIDRGGALWCWGVGAHGELGRDPETTRRVARRTRVPGDDTWVAVATGRGPGPQDMWGHTYAIRDDGTLWRWGLGPVRGPDGETGARVQIGAGSDWRSVSAAAGAACGIRGEGELWCWGHQHQFLGADGLPLEVVDPVRIGAGSDWVLVDRGVTHSCGIRGAGELWCWGENSHGQVGDGSGTARISPVRVGGDADWRAVRVTRSSTCALDQGDSRWCWGSLVDDGGVSSVRSPQRMDDGGGWIGLFPGGSLVQAMCGQRSDGTTWCWGQHAEVPTLEWQVPRAMTRTRLEAVAAWGRLTSWSRLAGISSAGACGVTADDRMLCWGHNDFGHLGRGTFGVSTPELPIDDERWVDVDAGPVIACGVRADGSAWCWGGSSPYVPGALGPWTDSAQSPRPVFEGERWRMLRVGRSTVCGIQADGSLHCDGAPVGSATDWTDLDVGTGTHCALRSSGVLHCGDDDTNAPVSDETGWSDVAVSVDSVCAIARGELHCGRVAGGTMERVGTSAGWTSIEAGDSETSSSSPVPLFMGVDGGRAMRVDPAGDAFAVSESEGSLSWTSVTTPGCGVAEGRLACWRGPSFDEMVDAQAASASGSPVVVLDDAGFDRLAVGALHGCGLRGDRIHCWGQSAYGAVGHGQAWSTEAVEALPLE